MQVVRVLGEGRLDEGDHNRHEQRAARHRQNVQLRHRLIVLFFFIVAFKRRMRQRRLEHHEKIEPPQPLHEPLEATKEKEWISRSERDEPRRKRSVDPEVSAERRRRRQRASVCVYVPLDQQPQAKIAKQLPTHELEEDLLSFASQQQQPQQ